MPFKYVPAGLGATKTTTPLTSRKPPTQPTRPTVSLITGEKTYAPKRPVIGSFSTGAKTPAPPVATRLPLTPATAPKKVLPALPAAAKRVPALAKTVAPPPMVRVSGENAKRLASWLNRRFGTSTPSIPGLKYEGSQVVIPREWYERYNAATKRVRRMLSRSTAVAALATRQTAALGMPSGAGAAVVRQNVAAFMAWWRKCDVEGWAAWDNAIVAGAGASKVPTQAFEYWNQRKNIRSVVNPATGALAAVFGSIRPSTFVAPPPPPAPPGSSMVFIPPTPSGSSSLLIDSPAGATRSSSSFGPAMSGLGQVSTNLSELRRKAAARRAAQHQRRGEQRALRERHAEERRATAGKTAVQRLAAAQQRRAERDMQQAGNVDAFLREREERSRDIAGAAGGVRAGVAESILGAMEQRRANREVPCASGSLKDMLFGFSTGLVISTPATDAAGAAARLRAAQKQQLAALTDHARRMAALRGKAVAELAASSASKDPAFVKNDTPDGGKTETDLQMDKLEEASRNAEESKLVSDEKEEQVNEIETVLEDAKDQLEEGKAQNGDKTDLTPEMKALQEQIDQLTGALADAKIEHENSLLNSAESSQAQITLMLSEIERLQSLLSVQPELEPLLDPYIDAYQEDIIIAQEDIADANVAIADAQADTAQAADQAAETADDILATEPFCVRHRNMLLLGGAVAVGAGAWWWWKKRSSKQVLTQNDGYYNLPEPKTPRRPSGL